MHVRGTLIRTHVAAREAAQIVLPGLNYGDIFDTEPVMPRVATQQAVPALK